MQFKNPGFLILLIPLALSILRAYFLMLRGKYAPSLRIPWKEMWRSEAVSKKKIFQVFPPRLWPLVGYGLGGLFLILALARPQTSFQKIKRNVEGIDMMVVLDLSASMRVEDFRDQNRIEVAKQILQEFIRGRQNDKIGFEVFSGEAVTLVPPTLDYALVLESLKNSNLGDLKDGTAIGDALATAVARLKESTAKSKVIVLLTDGDSNVGQIDPLTAGELAKGYGIKVYSIAIGREGRVAMPFVYKDVFGRQVKTYQYFDSSINPDLLRKIAASTGGKFYRVEDNVKLLREVFMDIDKLERHTIETTEQTKYEEQYLGVLRIGLVLLLMSFLAQISLVRVFP